MPADVAIVGAGPAGRCLAAHLVGRGPALRVALLDPCMFKTWPNTYGAWADELVGLDPAVPIKHSWPQAAVYLPKRQSLQRSYALIDNEAFQQALDARLEAADVLRLQTRVAGVSHGPEESRLHLEDGSTLRARHVVDAAGARSVLAARPQTQGACFQRAYGIEARFGGDPLGGDGMVLMDYRVGENRVEATGIPTFLYGMDLGDNRYFVEETVLVGPEVSFDHLKDLLYRRLEARGVAVEEVFLEERCHIEMGGALPARDAQVIGFGAAAGLVHPATGYSLGRMLRAAPSLATVIAQGLADGWSPEELTRRANLTLWPQSARRTRKLLLFGRDVLVRFDHEELHRFFSTFFALPDEDWADYLRGDIAPGRLSQIMWRLFLTSPLRQRWELVRAGVAHV